MENNSHARSEQKEDGLQAIQSPWALYIPEDMLLNILKIVVDETGPVPILCRTAQVCVYWRDISYHRDLWKVVDLSSGWIKKDPRGIHELSESRFGEYTTFLNLEAWFGLKDWDLNIIHESCTKLKSINLSSCQNLTGQALQTLADNFPCIECVELSNVAPIMLGTKELAYFLQQRGKQLKKIVLSMNDVGKGFHRNMADIYNICPELEHLDLSSLHVSGGQELELDVSALQLGCPRMKVLKLEDTLVRYTSRFQVISHGFVDLEQYSVPCKYPRVGTSDYQVLKNSYKLRKLKYSSMTKTDVNLSEMPCLNLEVLQLPMSLTTHTVLTEIKSEWLSSLKTLNLNWITGIKRKDLDYALSVLFGREPHFTQLEKLHLCGTSISWIGVTAILENCRCLKLLNCTFCSNIPKFWAREVRGELLTQLYKLINEGMPLETFKKIQAGILQDEI